ncbi:MAG: type II toxin-antitoxin system Phd/YefM family antitoxin [Acidobacteriota bacterium]
MRIAPVAEVKARFSRYLEECEREPIIVTKNGRAVAVLVAVTDEGELERLVLAHSPKFRRLLEAAESRLKKEGGVHHRDFWASVKR